MGVISHASCVLGLLVVWQRLGWKYYPSMLEITHGKIETSSSDLPAGLTMPDECVLPFKVKFNQKKCTVHRTLVSQNKYFTVMERMKESCDLSHILLPSQWYFLLPLTHYLFFCLCVGLHTKYLAGLSKVQIVPGIRGEFNTMTYRWTPSTLFWTKHSRHTHACEERGSVWNTFSLWRPWSHW